MFLSFEIYSENPLESWWIVYVTLMILKKKSVTSFYEGALQDLHQFLLEYKSVS